MKQKTFKKLTTLSLFFLLAGSVMLAHAETPEEIMKKAHLVSYYQGKDGKSQMLMQVFSKSRKEPIKKLFTMIKYDVEEGGEQMFLVYFTQPSDIQRTTFLVHKKINEDDYRRLYIPASDKILAIAGSRKQDPFMGSDFSYEDVSGRHYTKDNHKILDETTLDNVPVYHMESTPKENEDKIAKIVSWIAKDTFIPMKVEFYGQDGKMFKYYKPGKIINIQGYPTVIQRLMISPDEDTKTLISLNPQQTAYDIGMSEEIFSERSLKNPPMEFLK
ncbi:MAG: outer membrane lipoprotein-sorting protein [SAR324 cluster bacterium]|nr:outer membrane lipoprotein-sorting protein [SAR324 cluster bacterium]